jgi:hypothetical protein
MHSECCARFFLSLVQKSFIPLLTRNSVSKVVKHVRRRVCSLWQNVTLGYLIEGNFLAVKLESVRLHKFLGPGDHFRRVVVTKSMADLVRNHSLVLDQVPCIGLLLMLDKATAYGHEVDHDALDNLGLVASNWSIAVALEAQSNNSSKTSISQMLRTGFVASTQDVTGLRNNLAAVIRAFTDWRG